MPAQCCFSTRARNEISGNPTAVHWSRVSKDAWNSKDMAKRKDGCHKIRFDSLQDSQRNDRHIYRRADPKRGQESI